MGQKKTRSNFFLLVRTIFVLGSLVYLCMIWYVCMVTHVARVLINRVRLPILHVVS